MALLFCRNGEEKEIQKVNGFPSVQQHLREMGFNEGEYVNVISKNGTGMIVKVKNSRIAIDEKMASKIIVKD